MTCNQCDTPLSPRNKSGMCGVHYRAFMRSQYGHNNTLWGSIYLRKKATEVDIEAHFAEGSNKLLTGILTMLHERAAA